MTAQVMQPSRRGFLRLLGGALAAPAIVRVASLMPISALAEPFEFSGFQTVIPASQLVTKDLYTELTAITPRAFVPRLFVDIYRADPLLERLQQQSGLVTW